METALKKEGKVYRLCEDGESGKSNNVDEFTIYIIDA